MPSSHVQTPEGWGRANLLSTALPGKSGFNDGDWIEAPYITDHGIRLIQTGNIGIGEYLDKEGSRRFVSQQTFNILGCKWVNPGDLLICRLADPIGRACIVPAEVGNSVTAVDCTIYRPDPARADVRFMLHLLNAPSSLKAAADTAGGSTRQRISRSALGNLAYIFPPLAEQRRIAEILDTLDETIRKTEQLIAKLQQAKQGLLHDLLTRGIDDNGELRDPERHPEQFKDSVLGRIPKDWRIVTLGEVAEKIADRDHTTPQYVDQGVPMVSPTHFYGDEGVNFSSCPFITERAHLINCKKTNAKPGDVILHRIGAGLGRVRLVHSEMPTFSILHSLAIVRPRTSAITSEYLLWSFRVHDTLMQMGLGTQSIGVPDLGLDKIASLTIRLAPLEEQNRLTEPLRGITLRIEAESSELSKLRLIKSGLMDDLLTGRVRVPT